MGPNQGQFFYVLAGQLDININQDNATITDRNAITTSTYLTAQTYEIDGTTSPSSAAPEPATWLFLVAPAVFAAGVFLRRRA